jgi:hypothetical protein
VVIPFVETSVVSKVVLVVMPEIVIVLTVIIMLVIMMILVLLGMVVAGFEGVVSKAVRIPVMGINSLIVYSNWVVDICWTWGGSE